MIRELNHLWAALSIAWLSFACVSIQAQSESDVMLYSSHDIYGSARFSAMGSSFGALGGDISTMSTNPAGLGLFRSGEFTLTPALITSNTNSSYYGNEIEESDIDFAFTNLGYAQVYELDHDKWKYAQFGFAFNRLKDFHADRTLNGRQDESSLLDLIAGEALGVDTNDIISYDPFYIAPAYFTFLIDPYVDSDGFFYEDVIPDGTRLDQDISISQRGRMSETVFGGAANYDDRLYIGFSMAFQRAIRDELMLFRETVVDTGMTELDFYEFDQDLEVRGDGVNIKLGAIYRATDNIRIGGSYTSPTWFSFSNTWSTSWYSRFDNGDTYAESSFAIGLNQYRFRSPSRLTASLGLIIAKQAALNIEYEYLDFSGAKFSRAAGTDLDFSVENNEIARQYVPVGNLRIGGEWRYKTISLRGGFAYYPSPFEEGLTISSADRYQYSTGLGYRKDRFNLDLAYRISRSVSDYYPYDPDIIAAAEIEDEVHALMLTLGFRF
ncbi:MAG: hypothetical protein HKN79_12555 [Flavobacteriales bacterium]|nr:hypothetical protein [Flavobacteriales bacterium]